MFAKWWTPGCVKTRLAAHVGPAAAARFHELSVRTLLARLATAAERRWLQVTPAESAPRFVPESPGWEVRVQAEGDLGVRMAAFFAEAFSAGAERVVLIGSDCPLLPVELVQTAFASLADQPVVLGPAADGGYYLVGARAGRVPPIFDGLPWSTPELYRLTTARLDAAGIGWAALPQQRDVDTRDDLLALAQLVQGDPPAVAGAECAPLVQFLREMVS